MVAAARTAVALPAGSYMTRILAIVMEPWSPELTGAFLFVSGLTLGVLVAMPY